MADMVPGTEGTMLNAVWSLSWWNYMLAEKDNLGGKCEITLQGEGAESEGEPWDHT